MSKITDRVWTLAEPVVKEQGCELWDVEYVKEAGGWYLRLYIDKAEGVSINDCEAVSRAFDPILDDEDPIPTSYVFEVSSAGAERQLKRPQDFEKFMGSFVEVKLYKPVDGNKVYTGNLSAYNDGDVEIEIAGNVKSFEKVAVASVRLRIR
ncbi:MAG: ribosome maturation factor RimP [Ruminococcaceae bacterium]|nr:ribosome maturation factor RimP [Oscillospiraceae bacterium]